MKTKAQLTEALTAKGVGIPANANKAALEQLALANGIPLEIETPPSVEKEMEGEPGEGVQEQPADLPPVAGGASEAPEVQPVEDAAPQDDSELIASKVAAGLSYEGALEVIQRQREEDAKAKA